MILRPPDERVREGWKESTHVRVGQDELSKRGVKRVAVDSLSGGEDQVGRGPVPANQTRAIICQPRVERDGAKCRAGEGDSHGVTGSDHLRSRSEDVLDGSLGAGLLQKDGTERSKRGKRVRLAGPLGFRSSQAHEPLEGMPRR
jgi:hypothetical protein